MLDFPETIDLTREYGNSYDLPISPDFGDIEIIDYIETASNTSFSLYGAKVRYDGSFGTYYTPIS